MIRPIKLEIQGFRRFKDLQTVHFPEKGLLLLQGDSGAGKSTIMQALSYALDICPYPATTLKSWSGESMQVNLTLDTPNGKVEICRGKKTSIQFGDEAPKTGSQALSEGLKVLFGMDGELLSALTYRPQDTLGVFLAKDDAEKKSFLLRVLGLDSVEKAIDDAAVNIAKLKVEVAFAQGVLSEKQEALRKVTATTEVSPDPVIDETLRIRVSSAEEVVKNVKAELAALEAKLTAAVAEFRQNAEVQRAAKQEKLDAARNLHGAVAQRNADARRHLETRRDGIKAKITRFYQEINSIPQARRDLQAVCGRIVDLKRSKCYTCGQDFVAEVALDEEVEKQARLEEFIAKEPHLRASVEALEAELKGLVWTPDPQEASFLKIVSDTEAELRWLGKTITDTRVLAIQDAKESKMRELLKATADLSDVRADIERIEQTIATKARQRAKQADLMAAAQTEIESHQAKLAELESSYNAERDFVGLLGKDGFLGVIFTEVLQQISDRANKYLSLLPNTSHVSVTFETENAKGKKTISPVFWVDGHATTRASGLSGGMGASADLSVDLGVIGVVEERLGKAPGWICLDETFNGMPKGTKEQAIEILKEYATNRLVVVIDHSTEIKESFDQTLTVVAVGDRSVVQ